MNIRNPEKFLQSVWDWSFLNNCFGATGIRVTDSDSSFIERNEHFLLLETKGPGVPLPRGQIRAFRALAVKKDFTIIIVWGEPNKPRQMAVWMPGEHFARIPKNATLDDIAAEVSAWFQRAENNGKEVA